ncbi:MAG: LAGLIDADG family homing endonuclease [archaeon]|jgi:intein/homing endonuclease
MNSFKTPNKLTKNICWVIAAILCDGHIRKDLSGIVFEVKDLHLIKNFANKISISFGIKSPKILIRKRKNYNPTFAMYIYNKKLCTYLSNYFNIKPGKKSNLIQVPKVIKISKKSMKKAFLKGVFDTDGGKRGRGLGLTSLSEKFVDEVGELLKEFGVNQYKESWMNKKYQKKCFGSRFKIDANSMFLLRQSKANAKN